MHVFPHGDRWAVATEPGATPISEHPTREAALSAARAQGGEVSLASDDPTGLAAATGGDPGGAPEADAEPDRTVADLEDQVRLGQSGL